MVRFPIQMSALTFLALLGAFLSHPLYGDWGVAGNYLGGYPPMSAGSFGSFGMGTSSFGMGSYGGYGSMGSLGYGGMGYGSSFGGLGYGSNFGGMGYGSSFGGMGYGSSLGGLGYGTGSSYGMFGSSYGSTGTLGSGYGSPMGLGSLGYPSSYGSVGYGGTSYSNYSALGAAALGYGSMRVGTAPYSASCSAMSAYDPNLMMSSMNRVLSTGMGYSPTVSYGPPYGGAYNCNSPTGQNSYNSVFSISNLQQNPLHYQDVNRSGYGHSTAGSAR